MSNLIDCPITFHQGTNKFGIFANAFRVVPDSGQECFLDFCIYSAQENRAEVIARIRIHQSFLPIIQDQLSNVLLEIQKGAVAVPATTPLDIKMEDGLVRTSDGRLVFFTKDDGEA